MSYFYQSQMPSNAYSSVETQHPLIPREKTYMLDRKVVCIHSDDRDTTQWPESNTFQIELPEEIKQVESIRLLDTSFPNNQYVFSHKYRNTRIVFTVAIDPSDEAYDVWVDISDQTLTATIEEGFYTPTDLANEISAKMNTAVTEKAIDKGGITLSEDYSYNHFSNYYHTVKYKILFGNNRDDFTLEFDVEPDYSDVHTRCPVLPHGTIWNQPTRWGFGSYVGFEKIGYDAGAGKVDEPLVIDYADEIWMTPPSGEKVYSIEPPNTLNIFGENQIYMELDKYNGLDEIAPYSQHTNSLYNGGYHGKVRSAFAKIPVIQHPFSQYFDSRYSYLNFISVFHQPIERISKLKIVLRYHDGRLVDFRNMPFSFTLEFNCLHDEVNQGRFVRLPATMS